LFPFIEGGKFMETYLFDGILRQEELVKNNISLGGALALSWFIRFVKRTNVISYYNENDTLNYSMISYSLFKKENPLFQNRTRLTINKYFAQISFPSGKERKTSLPLLKEVIVDLVYGSRVCFALNPETINNYLEKPIEFGRIKKNV
jgi:hypothetical protein